MSDTASSIRPDVTSSDVHEHGWRVESLHATSMGHVLYVRCGACGTRRVDLQERVDAPPVALSAELRTSSPLMRPDSRRSSTGSRQQVAPF